MKQIFKPLRNYLQSLDLTSLLSAIYSLSQHLEWNVELPDHLKSANPFQKKSKAFLGFYLWELDTLAREATLHCAERGGKLVNDWSQVRKALNLIKEVENTAYSYADDGSIFSEMGRIAHRQFHWQQSVTHPDLARYGKIYSQDVIRGAVESEFGMSVEQVFVGSFGLLASYLHHPAISADFHLGAQNMLGFSVEPLLARYSTTIPKLILETKALQRLDVDWAYTFHPLRLHPLLEWPSGIRTCPLTGLLARRFTDGLYFDMVKIGDVASSALGPAFQAYIGEVLTTASGSTFTVLPEERFGTPSHPKDSVDWIVRDKTADLFVECKVLRLAYAGKSELAPTPGIDREHRKLAKAIAQIYLSLGLAIDGKYPHWSSNGQPIVPMLVTLDDWKLFTHVVQDSIDSIVEQELAASGGDVKLVKTYPYIVCCAAELEQGIQVMRNQGFHNVLKGLLAGDRRGWLISSYLADQFPDEMAEVQPLFQMEIDRMLQSVLPLWGTRNRSPG